MREKKSGEERMREKRDKRTLTAQKRNEEREKEKMGGIENTSLPSLFSLCIQLVLSRLILFSRTTQIKSCIGAREDRTDALAHYGARYEKVERGQRRTLHRNRYERNEQKKRNEL